jgi:hypothetical protein
LLYLIKSLSQNITRCLLISTYYTSQHL